MSILRRKTCFLSAILFFGFLLLAKAQSSSVAYVNKEHLISQMTDEEQLKNQLKQYHQQLQDKLGTKKNQLQQKRQQRPSTEAEYKAIQAQISTLEQQVSQQEASIQKLVFQLEQEKKALIQEKVLKAIQQVAQQKKYTSVLDQSQVLNYAKGDDITLQVLEALKSK